MSLPIQWDAAWPWLTIAALGLFHGINPAMGWLFAVALGLYQRRRRVVLLSLVPIALGHAAAVALAIAAAIALGTVVDLRWFTRGTGVALLAWAAWHLWRGHGGRGGRPRVGMRVGLAGLAGWSFLMAGAHGAGLMLIPALMPLCATPGMSSTFAGASIAPALLALGLHTAAMLLAIGTVSLVVYDRVGLAFLRTGWINLDWLWTAALAACGIWLLLGQVTM